MASKLVENSLKLRSFLREKETKRKQQQNMRWYDTIGMYNNHAQKWQRRDKTHTIKCFVSMPFIFKAFYHRLQPASIDKLAAAAVATTKSI